MRKITLALNLLLILFICPVYAEDSYTIILNHDYPVMVRGEYEYYPTIEQAYAVSSHVLMTMDWSYGHFPDDGKIIDSDNAIWFYMVNVRQGIKVFLVGKAVTVNNNLPAWAVEYLPSVEAELERDGGVEKVIRKFEKSSDKHKAGYQVEM
ncbi:MAG: hypothetical protein A2073_08415 [Deltaproteobacteria bacterium GWC2_42_11]|nr:MAG: hypothetical protein A2073_08415 [Deltaproteobacteria bacterium GWC2_42_11]HBO84142.1 hypothetical protein [Deltaproteobacteria bacterium]